MVDIDGVVSLFGAPMSAAARAAGGAFHSIDGIPHFLSSTAAAHLHVLSGFFELVWASGWEEKANEYLPHLLGLPAQLPFLRFAREGSQARSAQAHWKLAAIDAYAGERPLAWIDDELNDACHVWAAARPAPTLLLSTAPERGLTSKETEQLLLWAGQRKPSQASSQAPSQSAASQPAASQPAS